MLQSYLPAAAYALRTFPVFTAYKSSSRVFVTVATDYPRAGSATLWTSQISDAIDVATPLIVGEVLDYPATSSPFPMNVLPMEIARVLDGPGSTFLITFTNGEV